MSGEDDSPPDAGPPVVRYRPHHFLCSLGYQGKGYSPEFTANMTAVVMGRLRAAGGEDTLIEVTGEADSLCGPCPSRRGTGCVSGERIAELDAAHAAALGLAPGDRLTWGEGLARIRARVRPDDLEKLCGSCQWRPYGMCRAALERLHLPAAVPGEETDEDTGP